MIMILITFTIRFTIRFTLLCSCELHFNLQFHTYWKIIIYSVNFKDDLSIVIF